MRAVSSESSLTAQAGAAIREAILSGELQPGALYSVAQVAATLHVSRTPVREALLGLAEAGLVRVERNRGFRVVRQDARHLADVFGLRLLLEVPAARAAAADADPVLVADLEETLAAMRTAADANDRVEFTRLDRAFHSRVLAACDNRLLSSVVAGLRDTIATVGASTVGRSRSLHDIAIEHEPVLRAVRAGNPEEAERSMRAHLEHTRDLLIAQLDQETR